LTDRDGITRRGCDNETQWGEDVTHEASGEGDLCTAGWIHAYSDPYLAVLMNPVHANLKDPVLWLAEASGKIEDEQTKFGCQQLTTRHKIDLPSLTIEQRIEIAIRCAKLVYDDPAWTEWADNWLSGKDRSEAAAARAAVWAARAVAAAAAWAEARAAAETAWAAEGAEDYDIVAVIKEVVGRDAEEAKEKTGCDATS